MSQSRNDEEIIVAQMADDVHRRGKKEMVQSTEERNYSLAYTFLDKASSPPHVPKIATEEEIMLARISDDVCDDNKMKM